MNKLWPMLRHREHLPSCRKGYDVAMGVDKSWLEEAYHVMGLEYGGFNGYLEKALGVTPAMRKNCSGCI